MIVDIVDVDKLFSDLMRQRVERWVKTTAPNLVIFDEAENRLHAQKAVMALTMS